MVRVCDTGPASMAKKSTLIAGTLVRLGLPVVRRLRSDRSVGPHVVAAVVEGDQSGRGLSVAKIRDAQVLSGCQSLLTDEGSHLRWIRITIHAPSRSF
ncbi:MAG: hypothetical protein JWP89_5390 [Schlesneria sp.]|nr:hypothetical protein [Schlesneria sp.]